MSESEAILPSMTREEKVLDTVGTVAGLVPVLGGPVSSILLGLSGDRRFERVRACLIDLAEHVGHLDEEQEAFVKSEDFEDLLIETTRRVWAERSEEKRRVYDDFLVDAMQHPAAEPYDERLRFLRDIEEVQEAHIEVLRAILQDPDPNSTLFAGSMSSVLLKRLGWGEDDGARARLADLTEQLNDMRIIDAAPLNGMMTGAGAENTRGIVTPFGRRFTRYLEGAQQ
jgi:hypothetical protein